MKFRNFTKYKNRKLYCNVLNKYVTFPDIVELIREGYTIGVTKRGDVFEEHKAIIEGNKCLIKMFASQINKFSGSTIGIVASNFYLMWNLEDKANFTLGNMKAREEITGGVPWVN
tara:strand:- start:1851 stop:2195 length:345 start_codon:yes stop_codon:yes gene_type:complete